MMADKGILVVVSGFSGAGKGTLMKRLLEKYDNYALSVSATTRAPTLLPVFASPERHIEYFSIKAIEESIWQHRSTEDAQYAIIR